MDVDSGNIAFLTSLCGCEIAPAGGTKFEHSRQMVAWDGPTCLDTLQLERYPVMLHFIYAAIDLEATWVGSMDVLEDIRSNLQARACIKPSIISNNRLTWF